jgi:hypothetical protein
MKMLVLARLWVEYNILFDLLISIVVAFSNEELPLAINICNKTFILAILILTLLSRFVNYKATYWSIITLLMRMFAM